jgi:hypothetical protein
LKLDLDSGNTGKRTVVIYDADLPPKERRQIEAQFNEGKMQGGTLIATNALELGVDIENLDLCLLNTIPPKRADFIQRIGRVGRRPDRPGLVLLKLSAAPFDRYIAKNFDAAFRFDTSRSVPIPSDLEMLKLKNIAAIQKEIWYKSKSGKNWIGKYTNSWDEYMRVMEEHFGESLTYREAKQRLTEKYGILIDTSDKAWTHNGFRASASEGKIPLRVDGQKKKDVAWIEDINIFRDAHPEAVYLDAEGRRWRVKSYGENWKKAIWNNPDSDVVLAKYLKIINVVYVKEVKDPIATRGIWEESFKPYQILADPPDGVEFPAHGEIEYGIWEYSKKFDGYKEINLSTGEPYKVSLAEVSNRFKNAIEAGKDFPFLFPLSYITYGWSWNCQGAFKGISLQYLKEIEGLVGHILEPFIADAVQANPANLQIDLSLSKGYLWVLDATPGGNGLSEALLRDGRLSSAFSTCLEVLDQYKDPKMKDKFKSYVIQLCQEEATYEAREVIEIVKKLQSYWDG